MEKHLNTWKVYFQIEGRYIFIGAQITEIFKDQLFKSKLVDKEEHEKIFRKYMSQLSGK